MLHTTQKLRKLEKLNDWDKFLLLAVEILQDDEFSLNDVKAAMERTFKYMSARFSIQQFLSSNLTLAHIEIMQILADSEYFSFFRSSDLLTRINNQEVKSRFMHYKSKEYIIYVMKTKNDIDAEAIKVALGYLQVDIETIALVIELYNRFDKGEILDVMFEYIKSGLKDLLTQYADTKHIVKYMLMKEYTQIKTYLMSHFLYAMHFAKFDNNDIADILKSWKKRYQFDADSNIDALIKQYSES